MSEQDINVTIDQTDIDVTIDGVDINVTMSSAFVANYVGAGTKFYFDGAGGDTYLMYNATSKRLELWVEGTKQKEWGVVDGNPF